MNKNNLDKMDFISAKDAREKIQEIKFRKIPEAISILKDMITDAISKREYSIQFTEHSLSESIGIDINDVDDEFICKSVKPFEELGYKFSESHCKGRKLNFTLYHLCW